MILECTECHSRYLVPDTAIGSDGRTVRCANCRHSWFQQPALAVAVPASVQRAASDMRVQAPVVRPPAEPEIDAFAHQPPFKPRRNPARRWTAIALAAGVVMLAGTGAIVYTGTPIIAKQIGLGTAESQTPLRLMNHPIQRRTLSSGNELFEVSGIVTNPTGQQQPVPDIRADLRDAQGRLVYSWTITPAARTLKANANVEFTSAKLDVPPNSKRLELSFSSGL